MKAVEQKPDFDIALANLGNAIKDVGRPWDAIEYYRRATDVNPSLPEAVCGLVNSLCSVCDWRGRGAMPDEVGVDDAGHVILPAPREEPGWITRMAAVTDEQLKQGYLQTIDAGSLPAIVEQCMHALTVALDRPLRPEETVVWHARFEKLTQGELKYGNTRG